MHSKRTNVKKLASFVHGSAVIKAFNSYFMGNYQIIFFTKTPITCSSQPSRVVRFSIKVVVQIVISVSLKVILSVLVKVVVHTVTMNFAWDSFKPPKFKNHFPCFLKGV